MTHAILGSARDTVAQRPARVVPAGAGRSMTWPVWLAAAAASAGAGLIHLALGPAHVGALGALGLGFFLSAGLQLGWAALAVAALFGLAGWSRASVASFLVASGIAINVAVLAAWAVSRMAGLPAGEKPWTPEAVGLSDAVAGVFEGALVGSLVAWHRGWQAERPMRFRAALLASTIAIALISVGTVAAIQPSVVAHAHAADHGHGTEDAHGAEEPVHAAH